MEARAMSDTPTPETDAEMFYAARWADTKFKEERRCVSYDFARRLERERDEARKEISEIKEYLWPNQTGLPNEHRNALVAIRARDQLMQRQRDKLRAINAELAEALEEVMRPYGIYDKAVSSSVGIYTGIYIETGEKIRAAILKAKEGA